MPRGVDARVVVVVAVTFYKLSLGVTQTWINWEMSMCKYTYSYIMKMRKKNKNYLIKKKEKEISSLH